MQTWPYRSLWNWTPILVSLFVLLAAVVIGYFAVMAVLHSGRATCDFEQAGSRQPCVVPTSPGTR